VFGSEGVIKNENLFPSSCILINQSHHRKVREKERDVD